GGKRFGINRDETCSIFGDGAACRDDERDRLANIGQLISGKRIGIDVESDRARRQGEGDAGTSEVLWQLRIREDPGAAGMSKGRGRVKMIEARVCVRTAEERSMQHAGQLEVVDETALPTQQRLVLDALDSLSEEGR